MCGQANCARVVLAGTVLWAAICTGQEQWLQYRSARDVSLLGSGTRSVDLKLSADWPDGVEMPQFKAGNPLFAKWQTPMAKAGFLWIALDRSAKSGPYNLLYMDANGNGRLDDETPAQAYQMEPTSAAFGPVKVVFQVEGEPATYHLNLRYSSSNNSQTLRASSGGWYEGDITVGTAKKHCLLFDYNVNGAFDDRSPHAAASDRIVIGEKTGQDAALVGRYLEVDGVLYEPQIARDGAFIKLSKAENVKSGHIRLPSSVTSCSVGGENGSFTIKSPAGANGDSPLLPVGSYHILAWTAERTDDAGAKWQITGRRYTESAVLEVAEDKEAQPDIGEPIVATLQATKQGGTYSFRLVTGGRAGEQIDLLRNGTRPQAPKVRIENAAGTYDRTFNFEYG